MNWLLRLKLNMYDDRETKRMAREGMYIFFKEPTHILDLGAHKGFVTEWYATTYKGVPIHAYEPNPKLFNILKKRTSKYPNVTVFNEAIADHDGNAYLDVKERDVSSLLSETGISVPCVTLKTAMNRIGIPVSVKMDIEGAEFQALKDIPTGLQEIVGEVHPEKANCSNQELIDDLSSFENVRVSLEGKSLFHAV